MDFLNVPEAKKLRRKLGLEASNLQNVFRLFPTQRTRTPEQPGRKEAFGLRNFGKQQTQPQSCLFLFLSTILPNRQYTQRHHLRQRNVYSDISAKWKVHSKIISFYKT